MLYLPKIKLILGDWKSRCFFSIELNSVKIINLPQRVLLSTRASLQAISVQNAKVNLLNCNYFSFVGWWSMQGKVTPNKSWATPASLIAKADNLSLLITTYLLWHLLFRQIKEPLLILISLSWATCGWDSFLKQNRHVWNVVFICNKCGSVPFSALECVNALSYAVNLW